ncbi:cysteine proteinase [Schizophyllum commune Tattone D]|nr:cysteine proteinase [Schizophyllum commune Tattone D]
MKQEDVQTHSPPKPIPFTPSYEQQERWKRERDERINARLRPKRPPLPAALPPEDEALVDQLLRKRGVVAKFAREQVSDTDLSRLRPGQWLNDEVINFYGAMILGRAEAASKGKEKENEGSEGKGKRPLDIHYFNSFFWSKLVNEGYEKGRLARWTKKIDIFSKDAIILPVNHSNTHWTSAAINFRKKRIEYYDSLGSKSPMVYRHLRAYLDAESRNKKKKPFDFTGWEDYFDENAPQQENAFDCGVFSCQFMEAISRGEETFNFEQKNMPYLRRRMVWEIGNGRFKDDH